MPLYLMLVWIKTNKWNAYRLFKDLGNLNLVKFAYNGRGLGLEFIFATALAS